MGTESCFTSRWPRLGIGLVILAAVWWNPPPASAATGRIAGAAYEDLNRDGVREADEPAFAADRVDLYGAGGAFLQTTLTDGAGQYEFNGLDDGDYLVQYDASYWWNRRDDWVPTTTGSLFPKQSVHLAGSATADFGWRRIVRSTVIDAPISSYTGPNGLAARSYDDVLTAGQIYDALMQGSLIGAEASTITIYFDYTYGSSTTTSVTESNGKYMGYRANVYLTYVDWLDTGDRGLFHEYGHAWSQYYGYMVQQDATYSGYLTARGLLGDPRLGSSYPWNVQEIFAEDYRQLFGTANARSRGQLNGEIPPASDVAGLRDYLMGPYRRAPAADPASPAPLSISGVMVAPDPVKTSGTVSFAISAPGSVTVKIVNAKGSLVRTLLSNAAKPAGSVSTIWNRTDAAGHRVKRGSYSARVDAVDAGGRATTLSAAFSVY